MKGFRSSESIKDSLEDSPLFTQDEAAAYLRVCRNTLRSLGLPYVRIKHRLLFRKNELDAFIESQLVRADEERAKGMMNLGTCKRIISMSER